MNSHNLQKLKYPIGEFENPAIITTNHINHWIEYVETFPARLEVIAQHLSDNDLDYRYRPNG